ncbi:MAG TPA: hypothetical protein VFB12_07105 [Ktedonobacteraceae bacterium]|nr:hypothetical protein [Ktedonobacteraceae bacterium]
MYNDQPQQPPYGQPQSQYGVPPVPGAMPTQQPKRSRRWLWIVLGVIVGLLLVCGVGTFAIFNTIAHNPATDVVNKYYTAIKTQDYATAFQYLDPTMKMTVQGTSQQITSDLFTQVGQAYDTEKGKVNNYSITNTQLSTNNGVNTADLTVSVTRNGAAYDVHLGLRQEGDAWKIISFDNL